MKAHIIATALLAVAAVVGTTSCTKEAEAEPGKQTHCPVMNGNKIDPQLYVDVEGKRIYVCCAGCIAPIKADPAKYIGQMEAEGIVLEEAPGSEAQTDHSGHQQ